MLCSGDTFKLRESPKDLKHQLSVETQLRAGVMSQGMVKALRYELTLAVNEMDHPQQSPKAARMPAMDDVQRLDVGGRWSSMARA